MEPPTLILALSASAATIGDIPPPTYPILHNLITSSLGSPYHSLTFTQILSQIQRAPFHLDPHMALQYGLEIPPNPSMNLSDALQYILHHVLQSPHGLSRAQELIEQQSDADMHGSYEPDGVISCFLRRVTVTLAAMSFEALSRLLQDVRDYISGIAKPRKPGFADAQRMVRELAKGSGLKSREEVSAWTSVYRDSRRNAAATNSAIRSINGGRSDAVLLTAEYAMQVEAKRRRDFVTSVDTLHRYFDLSLAELGRRTTELTAQEDKESGSVASNELQGHQHAALSLGILQAQFGNASMAGVALDDTIRAAQQCGDQTCQASALSWIARTCESVSRRQQLLGHAGEQLALAREEISTMFSAGTEGIGGARENRSNERMARIRKRLKYNKPEQRVEALLISAAAWESHAALPTALNVAESAWGIVKEKDLNEEKARAVVAVAALCAREGDFEKAIELLRNNGARESVLGGDVGDPTKGPEVEILSRCFAWLQFERSIAKGDAAEAERLLGVLKGFEVCAKNTSIPLLVEDIILDSIEARCRFKLLLGAPQEAAKEAELLCRRAARLAKAGRVVEGMRLRAEAHLQNELYGSALPPALAAVSLSDGLGLESAKVRSALTLTETILRMEEQDVVSGARALKALLPVLPKALRGMGVSVRARGYRLHAECLLAEASAAKVKPDEHVVELLEHACEAYETAADVVGVRDSLYLLARVHHWRGDHGARNMAACKFNEQMRIISAQRITLT